MKKLKVVTVVGTRPEIIRLSRVLCKLDEYCDHTLIHTGQNYDYELNEIFFKDLQIKKPDFFLNIADGKMTPSEVIGNLIMNIDSIFHKINPEAVLILGDTNSSLSAISAKRRKIPIFHMEAGNRCFDMRVPEEINRRLVDHIADVNLTYSSIAKDYLLREGLQSDLIIKTGSPMFEVLSYYKSSIDNSDILSKINLSKNQYFLLSVHREENIENSDLFNNFINILNWISEEYNFPVIVSTHPRTKNIINQTKKLLHKNVKLMKPFGFFDYMKLQISALTVLSDSGTINEESSILNFPALNLRESHERPEGMEEGAVMMVGLSLDRVRQGILILSGQSRDQKRNLKIVNDYNVDNVSEKILRIIHSYTDYVNRVVWKKY